MVDTLHGPLPPVGSIVLYHWYLNDEAFEAPALVTSHPLDGNGRPQANAALNMWVAADPSVALKGGMATPMVHRHAVPHILHAKAGTAYWTDIE